MQEVVLTGKDIDVTQLPILTYHEKDAGRYITAGFGIMRDPDSGVRNAGIYRLMIHSKDTFGIQLSETAHGHYIWQTYERQNRPTPMAVAIGHHPAFYIGCLSFTSLETDEFSVAGGIIGEPVELVRCRTLTWKFPRTPRSCWSARFFPSCARRRLPLANIREPTDRSATIRWFK